jgi:hypothetical protein
MIAESKVYNGLPITGSGLENTDKREHILLSVWKEACRHTEISESTQTIATLLAEHLPPGQILVRRFDLQRSCLETVAAGISGFDHLVPDARTTCSPAEFKELLTWSRKAKVDR